MSQVFFSDPHLGKNLISHTTPVSRQRLKDKLYQQVVGIELQFPKKQHGLHCGGDLFDRFSNKEDTVYEAYRALRLVDTCLAGNHDLIADSGELSSLQLLHTLLGSDSPVILEPDSFMAEDENGGETIQLLSIPHVFNQTAFDEALQKVKPKRNCTNILLLHCNYDCEFATDETSLNLSAAAAKWLLDDVGFDYILLGHEHQPAKHFGGRLIVMGNTHPTSFGDISDKFVWEFKEGKFLQHQIYSAKDRYWEVPAEDLLNPAFNLLPELEWVRVIGTITPEQSVPLMRQVRKIWDLPNILAVKVDTTLSTSLPGLAEENVRPDMTMVLTQIDAEVAPMGESVVELWKEIKAAILAEKEKE